MFYNNNDYGAQGGIELMTFLPRFPGTGIVGAPSLPHVCLLSWHCCLHPTQGTEARDMNW